MSGPITEKQFRWACNTKQMAAFKARQPAGHEAVQIMAGMWTELEAHRLRERFGISAPEIKG